MEHFFFSVVCAKNPGGGNFRTTATAQRYPSIAFPRPHYDHRLGPRLLSWGWKPRWVLELFKPTHHHLPFKAFFFKLALFFLLFLHFSTSFVILQTQPNRLLHTVALRLARCSIAHRINQVVRTFPSVIFCVDAHCGANRSMGSSQGPYGENQRGLRRRSFGRFFWRS